MKKLLSIIGMTFNGILVGTELVLLLIGERMMQIFWKSIWVNQKQSEIITHMSMDSASDTFQGITVYLKFGIIS